MLTLLSEWKPIASSNLTKHPSHCPMPDSHVALRSPPWKNFFSFSITNGRTLVPYPRCVNLSCSSNNRPLFWYRWIERRVFHRQGLKILGSSWAWLNLFAWAGLSQVVWHSFSTEATTPLRKWRHAPTYSVLWGTTTEGLLRCVRKTTECLCLYICKDQLDSTNLKWTLIQSCKAERSYSFEGLGGLGTSHAGLRSNFRPKAKKSGGKTFWARTKMGSTARNLAFKSSIVSSSGAATGPWAQERTYKKSST